MKTVYCIGALRWEYEAYRRDHQGEGFAFYHIEDVRSLQGIEIDEESGDTIVELATPVPTAVRLILPSRIRPGVKRRR